MSEAIAGLPSMQSGLGNPCHDWIAHCYVRGERRSTFITT